MNGIFKELYRGYGIYWHGKNGYGDETKALSRTIAEDKARIDALIAHHEAHLERVKAEKLASGKYIACYRNGDEVTVHTPNGIVQYSLREFRNRGIDEVEEKYAREILWA